MGFVGDVSAVLAVAVSHGLGTNPAAVLLFRKRFPSTFWLGFAWWLAGLQVFRCTKVNVAEGNPFSFLLVGSVGNVSAVFVVAVSHGLGTNPAAVLLFRKRSPSTFWLGFAWWLAGLQVFRCTKVNVAKGNSFSFLLVGSVGNVSAVFVVAVSHGLGTNPAAVLLFRKRSPSTFWLGFAWWLAGFQVFRCTKVNVVEGNPFSFLLVGSVGDISAVFVLRFRMGWARILLLRESCCWATCRLAEGNSFSFLLVGSVGDVSALFAVAVSHGLGTNPAAVLLFRKRSPNTFWLGFAWWLAGLQVFRCTKVNVAKGNSFSFLLVGSVGNVAAIFVVAVSHGLDTNPAVVLLFRKRSPSTFWLGFAWWLTGFQVFCCTKVNLAEGNPGSFLLMGSVGDVSWLRYRMASARILLLRILLLKVHPTVTERQ